MTQTKQPHSLAHIQDEETDISFNCYLAVKEVKASVKDNLQLMNSICKNMNDLCTAMERFDNLMETIIFCENKENGR